MPVPKPSEGNFPQALALLHSPPSKDKFLGSAPDYPLCGYDGLI
jgi:hypothetical protein